MAPEIERDGASHVGARSKSVVPEPRVAHHAVHEHDWKRA
jgi:hypothetical protein